VDVGHALFAKHFRDDEDYDRAENAAAKEHVNEGVANSGNGRESECE
jgi:hypothetical protein